jgi:hypothetical protein
MILPMNFKRFSLVIETENNTSKLESIFLAILFAADARIFKVIGSDLSSRCLANFRNDFKLSLTILDDILRAE